MRKTLDIQRSGSIGTLGLIFFGNLFFFLSLRVAFLFAAIACKVAVLCLSDSVEVCCFWGCLGRTKPALSNASGFTVSNP